MKRIEKVSYICDICKMGIVAPQNKDQNIGF